MEELRELPTQSSSGMRSARRTEHRSSPHGQHSSRHELGARIASLRKQRLALSLASAGLLVAAGAVGYAAYHFSAILEDARARRAEEQAASESRLRDAETELLGAREALAAAQASIGMLVEKRIPGLRPLQPDQAIAIGDHSVRDITFTALRGSDKTGFEYKVVIENGSSVPLSPMLSVLLFDAVGVELGRSRIGSEVDGKRSTLRPGEIRSYFAVVKLDPGREAAFFRLDSIQDPP